MDKITTQLRVTSLKVTPFTYKDENGDAKEGEALEMRASGFWTEEEDNFPASLHVTVYPGHATVPAIGDNVSITVERSH